jgi:protocatechuate 3,4-dioxygenase beta subunit
LWLLEFASEDALMRRNSSVLAAVAFLALFVVGAGPEISRAEEDSARASIGPLAGVVVDAQGHATAGAEVWLYSFYWEGEYRCPTLAETVTDAQGRFQFPKTEWNIEGKSQLPYLLARDAQGRLAPAPYLRQPRDAATLTDLRLTLQEVGVFQGRVVDQAGQPIPQAAVRATLVNLRGEIAKTIRQLFVPDVLAEATQTTTADDGSFSLGGMPSEGVIYLKITAPGYGSPMGVCNLQRTVTIQLARTGRVSGRLLGLEAARPDGTWTLSLGPDAVRAQRTLEEAANETMVTALFTTLIEAKADGTFERDEVPAGKYVLRLRTEETTPEKQPRFYAEDLTPFEVRPGETASVALQMRPAIPVRGKVIDKSTKAGVPNVTVNLHISSTSNPRSSVSTTTDARGAFVIYTCPGKASIRIYEPPGNYVPETQRGAPVLPPQEISGPVELPPIELVAAAGVEGIVVDEAGKPVADAQIYYIAQGHSLHDPVRSDAQGKFSLAKLPPSTAVPVKARTANAVADQSVVKPGEMQEPLRLVVSEKNAFTIRGQVVDGNGQPIGGAEVKLTASWWIGNSGYGMSLDQRSTDGQGRFEFTGLWAGDQYQVEIAKEAFGKYESPDLRGEAGCPHDLGTIVLRGAQGMVEGLVTDSAGKPLADVRVFNSGDGPQPASTQTDAAGRFRLEGLFPGPAWVFAEKSEYRFAAIRTQTGATDATLRMLRTGEPMPERPAPRTEALREEQRKLAKELAETFWAEGSADQKGQSISTMARLDLEQAQKWSAEIDGKYGGTIREAAARRIAEDDPEEAVALLSADGSRAHYLLLQTAKRLAASDAAKAIRFAEEAVVTARALNQPARTLALANCGLLVTRLGNQEAGRKLLEEAAEMAPQLPTGETQDYYLGRIAVALGSYDVERALKLLVAVKDPRERQRYQAKIAAWCLGDLDKAEAILKDVEPWYANRARHLLAYRLAADRPDDALRVAERIGSGAANDYPNRVYGWLALAVAPRDRQRAWALIDKALAAYTASSAASRGHLSYGGEPAQAALLALQARRVEYPDLERLVWQVLAQRPTTTQDDSPARVVESQVIMALFLALVDPDLARQMLEDLQSRSELVGAGHSGVGREHWVNAWALVDTQRALEIAERETAAVQQRRTEGYRPDYVTSVMSLWSLPPDEMFERIASNLMDCNPPEDERW